MSSVLCGLFSDVLSFMDRKKVIKKKNFKVTLTDGGSVRCWKVTKTLSIHSQLGHMKHTKTGFIKLQVIAVK